jgi:hypothetical protein
MKIRLSNIAMLGVTTAIVLNAVAVVVSNTGKTSAQTNGLFCYEPC